MPKRKQRKTYLNSTSRVWRDWRDSSHSLVGSYVASLTVLVAYSYVEYTEF